jgi:outer membrane protein assembly factor BamB
MSRAATSVLIGAISLIARLSADVRADDRTHPFIEDARANARLGLRFKDSPQWGRTGRRNNVAPVDRIPLALDIESGKNIKWSARLGSQTYSSPVIANGKVFIGSNNAAGYIKRFPRQLDLGVLLCFDAATGTFLWQHSNEKLPDGRSQDWEDLGCCSSSYVEGQRLWYVNNRNEVFCLDTEGFLDGENDGPFRAEPNQNRDEADVIWKLDLVARFGATAHNATNCSITAAGDILFVCTANGVDEGHKVVPHPDAACFTALDKQTGEVLWSDKSPGGNILHGQWSSPAYGVLGGVPQVLFAGGDGWLYSFDPMGEEGKSKLLWKFDCNPKSAQFKLRRATRLSLIAPPVIYDSRVYISMGEDPEHGGGSGHLWCIDPAKRGDVSPTIVYNKAAPNVPIAHKRLQACEPDKGDFERPNENSALLWHYGGNDPRKPDQTMHRSLSSPAIKDDLLFISDQVGLVHCVNAKTGTAHWTHDMEAASWSTPLIAGDTVCIASQEGVLFLFALSAEKKELAELSLEAPVYNTPVVADDVLYVATFHKLYAIAEGTATRPAGEESK